MKKHLLTLGLAALFCLPMAAQVTLKGIPQGFRMDDGEDYANVPASGDYFAEYIGWCPTWDNGSGNTSGKAIYDWTSGIYQMTWNGSSLTTPSKNSFLSKADVLSNGEWNMENAKLMDQLGLMCGNSGAVYIDGQILTVMSRGGQTDGYFEGNVAVRKWDAKTGKMLYNSDNDASLSLTASESAGMAYNPVDGEVYGLFYFTDAPLSEDIASDPDYYVDEEDNLFPESAGTDAGYCLCKVDLKTMKVTPITPGLFYNNFVTFAINSDGRAFALTSGAIDAPEGEDGKLYDINNELTGAQLYEFDLKTGLYYAQPVAKEDADGEVIIDYIPAFKDGTKIPASGYASQYKRQSACFAKSNPNIMYWNGFFNGNKGVNDWGSKSGLDSRNWKTNGKYDTCLYQIDITTGEATRLSKIPNRFYFSCLWVDGDAMGDGSGYKIFDDGTTAIKTMNTAQNTNAEFFSISGQRTNGMQRGINIVKNGSRIQKVVKK